MSTEARPMPASLATAAELRRRRIGRRRLLNQGLIYGVATLLALWVLLPIYLITVSSFSPRDVIFDYPKSLIPQEVSADSILFFANSTGVIPALWRSVQVALVALVLSLLIGAPAGYALARYAFRGRNAFRLLIVSTKAFPIVILSIPLAVAFIQAGIYDSIWSVALMHTALALPFTVLITSSVFVSVPRELEEAAQTLGCTPLRAFLKVSLPLALPGLAAAAIFTFVLSWNEVFAAVILTLRERTLPALVLSVLTQSPLPFRFAAAFFMLAPSLIVIFFIRRYLIGLWGRVIK
ncbi:MAG TPA: carbohydrate ABC transporter permease [Candidatus Limnocylindria bacterium]|nr:carbohydrate ABC transporter permease [Candidatus Limnocylindria bacterium]